MSTSAGPQAPKNSGGGSAAWTPTGGRAVLVERISRATDFRLSVKYDPRESSKKSADRKKVDSLHPTYPGAPGFLGTGKMKRWTTEEAARAAIPHFRDWVDGGRRAPTQSLAAARKRSAAELAADHLPERFSKRNTFGATVRATLSAAVRGGVMLALAVAATPMSRAEYNAAWSDRSLALHRAVRARRTAGAKAFDVTAVLGGSVDEAERADGGAWRATTSHRVAVRGLRRGSLVSVHRRRGHRPRPDRHVQRTEERLSKLELQVRQAREWRVGAVERLKRILLSGDVAPLLNRGEGEEAHQPLSPAQTSRLTTQGWALIAMYKELDRLEAAVAAGLERVPKGGELRAAAAVAAKEYAIHFETVRSWQLDFVSNDGRFAPDQRGKWARELLIHEEDLQRKFHKWMIATAKEEKLSVDAALEYLNGTLLRPPHTTDEMLKDYHISLPISNKTAWYWMRKSGAQSGKFKQSYYNDHHEAELVKRDRADRYIPDMDRDELRQPLWVQISRKKYDALAHASKAVHSEVPLPRHEYVTPEGESMVEMVELHVDDSDHFEAFRAAHPLGGDFSVRWSGRPETAPSSPPSNLPNPAEDTLPAAAEAAAAEAAAEAAAAQPTATPAVPQPLSKTEIRASLKQELVAACEARGLEATGTVAVLRARLLALLVDAPGEGDAPADTPAVYIVNSILDRRVNEGRIEYLVSWEGYGAEENSWEPESNLDDCPAKLAAFYSNPCTQCPGCIYGHHRDVCRCCKPLYHVGHDECIFRSFLYSIFQWAIKGVRALRKKSEGPGEMMSAMQDEIRGFGFPMTPAELERVNAFRALRGRPALDCSPGVRFLSYGKNKDGYWDYEMFAKQVVDFMDAFDVLHPEWQLMLEVDWSSGHAKHLEGALNVIVMNVGYGGGQKVPRESTIPDDAERAKLYLGSHNPQLKPGDTQYFYFREDDPPPFNAPQAPKKDEETTKRNRKGECIIKEGYVGKAKGLAQIAWERGLYRTDAKMHGNKIDPDDESTDPTLSLRYVLANCWDFAHEKTALVALVESRGHICRFCVKGHPELAGAGIEYSWGKAKQKFRRDVNDRIPAHLHKNIVACFSRAAAFLPLARVRKFARKTRAYRRAYRDGQPNSLADVEKLVKAYKSHRAADVFDKKFCHADD